MSISLKTFQEGIKELSEKKKSELNKKAYKLKDLFDIEKGKSLYTKNYGNLNKGDNPVYSASNNAPLTYINTNDYDGQYLTWATNGFAGYMMLIDGKFSINGDRGLLNPKMPNINLLYVKNIVEPKLRELAKGRKGENGSDEFTKVYPNMVEEVEIVMPIDEDGNFDLETQKDVVDKILYVEDIKKTIEEYKSQIENLTIEIDTASATKLYKIKDLFDLNNKTNSSKFTKSFIDKNKGAIPVYSASKFPDTVDYGFVKDNLQGVKYFEDCLTWNIDGSIGKVHYRNGRFSLSEKVIPLIVKDEYKDTLDLLFLKHTIELEFSKHSFGFSNKAGKGKIQEIEIAVPISKNGTFNLDLQRQIADKFEKIEVIKKSILGELDRISKTEIDFE
jgi:hypothetical protein